MTKKIIYRIIGLYILFLWGCGYTVGTHLEMEKLYIEPVVNEVSVTYESGAYPDYSSYPLLIEKKLKNALVDEFNRKSKIKIVKEAEGVFRLVCRIYDYRKEALRYNDAEEVSEQRLRLYVKIQLYNQEGKLEKERDIVGETTYFLEGQYRKSEAEAWEDLIQDTARRILEAISQEW